MLFRIVFAVVHAHDDRKAIALGRGGNDDFFAPAVMWPCDFSTAVKRPVHSMTSPRPAPSTAVPRAIWR